VSSTTSSSHSWRQPLPAAFLGLTLLQWEGCEEELGREDAPSLQLLHAVSCCILVSTEENVNVSVRRGGQPLGSTARAQTKVIPHLIPKRFAAEV
jgi:hypothetical protein